MFLLEENNSDSAGLAAIKRKELLLPPIMAPLGLAARLAEAFKAPASASVIAPGVAP
ncbi:hypothetical protein B2J93_8817 [Marssonina coronariae]|uniref:Uncharacterized protein n=1 Tax=Diplocarpon coronariae TaxID=2795749 RepID=A0A218ZGM7_9HELO|nr:hypothetical protein B2J93_8817 [Marssonina coronariae]